MSISRREFLGSLFILTVPAAMVPGNGTLLAQRGAGGGRGGHGGRRPGGPGGRRPEMQQTTRPPGESRFERVCKVLGVEDEQMEKAEKLFSEMQEKKAEAEKEFEEGVIGKPEMEQRIESLGDEFEEDFVALLDKAQKEQFEHLKEEKKLEDNWW